MGNLMPRFEDNVFQENLLDNIFVNKILSFAKIGIIPKTLSKYQLEFTPIDYAANAVYKLIKGPTSKNRIFILQNEKTVSAYRLVRISKQLKHPIKVIPDEEYSKKMKEILEGENTKHLLNYIINDFNEKMQLEYNNNINIKSNFTIKYLRKLHFRWPKITNKYLIKFTNLFWKEIENDNHK